MNQEQQFYTKNTTAQFKIHCNSPHRMHLANERFDTYVSGQNDESVSKTEKKETSAHMK